MGSSPLARGLPATSASACMRIRIIPARAGFTWPPPWCRRCARDHPRSRGVYGSAATRQSVATGSSPLARGLLPLRTVTRYARGIIPARAGFTSTPPTAPVRSRDHPRSRGVYLPGFRTQFQNVGSSPLARGLRTRLSPRPMTVGIIPARAGFTRASAPCASGTWDHPRSRGVYSGTPRRMRSTVGSSPLARGLREGPDVAHGDDRIIPARAGFTTPNPPSRVFATDHPRSRGVYYHLLSSIIYHQGSSPLARGLRWGVRVLRPGPRIIPARAGFTDGSRQG